MGVKGLDCVIAAAFPLFMIVGEQTCLYFKLVYV